MKFETKEKSRYWYAVIGFCVFAFFGMVFSVVEGFATWFFLIMALAISVEYYYISSFLYKKKSKKEKAHEYLNLDEFMEGKK